MKKENTDPVDLTLSTMAILHICQQKDRSFLYYFTEISEYSIFFSEKIVKIMKYVETGNESQQSSADPSSEQQVPFLDGLVKSETLRAGGSLSRKLINRLARWKGRPSLVTLERNEAKLRYP